MQYDPIKAALGKVFNRTVFLRKTFYRLLDLLLLRAWHVHSQLRQYFAQHPAPAPIQVLDAGSGFGQYSWFIARQQPQWQITGIEIKEEQVADCNDFFSRAGVTNARFELADLTQYQLPQHYDLILSVDVMEHIEEDVQVFRNFFASLTSGGTLLISTPSNLGGSGVEHDHDASFIEEHVRDGYAREEITQKLQQAGFNNISVNYTYGTPASTSYPYWRTSPGPKTN